MASARECALGRYTISCSLNEDFLLLFMAYGIEMSKHYEITMKDVQSKFVLPTRQYSRVL
jgi:hypothetical protein